MNGNFHTARGRGGGGTIIKVIRNDPIDCHYFCSWGWGMEISIPYLFYTLMASHSLPTTDVTQLATVQAAGPQPWSNVESKQLYWEQLTGER